MSYHHHASHDFEEQRQIRLNDDTQPDCAAFHLPLGNGGSSTPPIQLL